VPLLCTRAAADPTLFDGGLAGGARAGHAVAVADYIGCSAGWDTRVWVLRGRGRVTVVASEPAGVSINACRRAVIRVVAVRRCIALDLKSRDQVNSRQL
jgi:hypothetical protein